ncbi:MAG TPA: peroxidase family protein [Solirubrobacteraceae bacterium]|nr:peroxidase family protein [Solirubrobacteraceae bacterium]
MRSRLLAPDPDLTLNLHRRLGGPTAAPGLVTLIVLLLAAWLAVPAGARTRAPHPGARTSSVRAMSGPLRFTPENLDGHGNNRAHPDWGQAGSVYLRITPARYADGIGAMTGGPNPRYVSDRIFNSLGVDLFSARYVSQWGWVWGQFLDHTFGLAQAGRQPAPITFAPADPLEAFPSSTHRMDFSRDAVAAGTGRPGRPRQQVNTLASYLDASAVYGQTRSRLDWLLQGPDNGRLSDSGPKLMLPGGYLPTAAARGNPRRAPYMQTEGMLASDPAAAYVAGDVRANDNTALTAVQTLFAREHNRIAAALPRSLPALERFQIARRVVAAEQQYITYTQFLPAMGVRLAPYRGYRPGVDPGLDDEFATVGYRAHSMVNGEEHIYVPARAYGAAARARLTALGVSVSPVGSRLLLTLGQADAFFHPQVLPAIGLGPVLRGLAQEPEYRNDVQIDDSLRSTLFSYPAPGNPDPAACFVKVRLSGCFTGISDLGAIDLQRERDHGMPTYAQLRRALGLPVPHSFTALTGEATDRFPSSLGPDPINNPQSLQVTDLRDLYNSPASASDDALERAVSERQRSTLAARLKAIYGSVSRVDAFVGMLAEPHVADSEFGPLQLALWRRQFTALRDGDRFFYARDPVLREIERRFHISYRQTLGELIARDAGVSPQSMERNVFYAPIPPRREIKSGL